MALALKACLGVISLIGICSAVSVPLAMNSSENNLKEKTNVGEQVSSISDRSDGGGHREKAIQINYCGENQDMRHSLITFGSKEGESFCGKIKPEAAQEQPLEESNSSLTSLFQKMGHSGVSNGNSMGQSLGKSVCSKDSKGGVLTPQGKEEYLGYCNNSSNLNGETKEFSFLEIDKANEKVNKISICQKNCGNNTNTVTLQQLSNKVEGNGKEVGFYNTIKKDD